MLPDWFSAEPGSAVSFMDEYFLNYLDLNQDDSKIYR
jgi:hypothetical protein